MKVQVSATGHYDHPINGDWDWPAIPRQDELVHYDDDVFSVRAVDWIMNERGLERVYVVLRAVSVAEGDEQEQEESA